MSLGADIAKPARQVRRLQIDHQLGCSTGRSAGLAPLKILSTTRGGPTIKVSIISSVGQKEASLRQLSLNRGGRQPVPQSHFCNLAAMTFHFRPQSVS